VPCVPKQSNCASVAWKINHFAQDLISRRNKQAARKICCHLTRVIFPQYKSSSKQIGSRVAKFTNNRNWFYQVPPTRLIFQATSIWLEGSWVMLCAIILHGTHACAVLLLLHTCMRRKWVLLLCLTGNSIWPSRARSNIIEPQIAHLNLQVRDFGIFRAQQTIRR